MTHADLVHRRGGGERGVPAVFVGHPLIERLNAVPDWEACRGAIGVPPDARLVGLLSGSRTKEVGRCLRIFADAFGRIACALSGTEFVLGCGPGVDPSRARLLVRAVAGLTHELMRASDLLRS